MKGSDPASGTQTVLLGIACLASGLAGLGFAAWCANDEIRKNGRLDGDAISGVAIIGCGGLMFLGFGVVCTYCGWKDRESARVIHQITAIDPPPESAAWKPPPTVTDHLGQPLGFDRDFFVPPPPEIGEILSADSSLRLGGATRTRWVCVGQAVAVSVLAGSVV